MGNGPAYWDKLRNLIDAAKEDPELRTVMRNGSDWEKIKKLQEYDFTAQEIDALQADMESISDSTNRSWWSF